MAIRKVGILSPEVKQDLHSVLKRMNKGTTYKLDASGYTFESQVFSACALKNGKDKILLHDSRHLLAKLPEERPVTGYSTISFNDKDYFIDNETGEITRDMSFKQRLFESTKHAGQKITEIIEQIKNNFGNPDVVERRGFGIMGVTEKGDKIIQEARKKALAEMRNK